VARLRAEAFGKYVLLSRLAVGGMAEVYLARLEGVAGFQKPVVLKQVLPHLAGDPQFIEMFLDEARLAARLSHPNIAEAFELGQEQGRYYIAMEYVEGETVTAVHGRAQREGREFPLQCTLRVVLELLEALQYAHGLAGEDGRRLHVVHRDVSPSNVMVTYHGGVKLLDFGIARAATRNHRTGLGIIRGKHGYMAPEQCHAGARIDHRADLFATGAVLYALATGRPAFFGTRSQPVLETVRQMQEARFPPPRSVRPELSAELEDIIMRAMARLPRDRYQDARTMAKDLERFAAAEGIFPSGRPLGQFVRGLFPEKAPLAHAPQPPDAKTLVELIEQVGDEDIVAEGGET
jgi:serine/threonine-protein kinase